MGEAAMFVQTHPDKTRRRGKERFARRMPVPFEEPRSKENAGESFQIDLGRRDREPVTVCCSIRGVI
jgi:hypothetical protein